MPSVPKLFSINTSCSDHTSIAPSLSPIVPPPPDNTPLTPAESKQSVISKKHTTMESTSFYGVGSLLGEVALLEDESTNLHACCETGVKVFHIQRLEAERLLFRHAELEERLWKLRGVSVAAVLMERLVEYKARKIYLWEIWICDRYGRFVYKAEIDCFHLSNENLINAFICTIHCMQLTLH